MEGKHPVCEIRSADIMTIPPLLFQSETHAWSLIAGLPCAARAVRNLDASGAIGAGGSVKLLAPGGWENCSDLQDEIRRLAPGITASLEAYSEREHSEVLDALGIAGGDISKDVRPAGAILERTPRSHRAAIASASRRVIAATGKPEDGVVSRWINRPISRAFSYFALKAPGIRPIHGTFAAATLGLAMAVCLFAGGENGLIAGAILFQLASIVDGVDGEIARATFRTSKTGATLDTATDATTNFAFIAGVSANLLQRGDETAAWAGFGGLALLATGLAIIGTLSMRGGGALSFDMLKNQAKASPSRVMQILAKITSRDVYALALALLIIAGLAVPALIGFAIAIAVWFVSALILLARRAV